MRNTVESGEEMRFENEEIHFKNALTIEGSAIYENCKIFCYEDGSTAAIELAEDGELTFRECEITFCGANGDDEYFISIDDGSLKMEHCKLYNLYRFVQGNYSELYVSDCEFLNSVQYVFATDTDETAQIENCRFLSREMPDFVGEKENIEQEASNPFSSARRFGLFTGGVCGVIAGAALRHTSDYSPLLEGAFEMDDCTFEFDADMKRYAIEYLSDVSCTVSDCTFVNDRAVPAHYLDGNDITCMHCGFEV